MTSRVTSERLTESMTERVLAKLGFDAMPAVDRAGLASLYSAWCRHVPFDNVRKLVHLRAGDLGPLPGDDPIDFFQAWQRDGAGGTCWALHGAFAALLEVCRFDVRRAIATMLVAPDVPPNHGSASVRIGGETLLVDGCIQHGEPLVLDARRETAVAHPAYGVRARWDGGRFLVRWRSPFALADMDCRLESQGGDAEAFRAYHEQTRAWSPFNFELFVRVHRAGGVLMAVRGERIFVAPDGTTSRTPLVGESRRRFLVDEIGFSEALAGRLPEDVATPPPPGSRTAEAGRARAT